MNRRKAIKSVLLLTPTGYIGFTESSYAASSVLQNVFVGTGDKSAFRPWNYPVDPREHPDDARNILRMTGVRPELPMVLEAVYANTDEEYADSLMINKKYAS